MDCRLQRLVYVSSQLVKLLDTNANTLLTNTADILAQHITEKDKSEIALIHRNASQFLKALALDARLNMTLSYDICITLNGVPTMMRNELILLPPIIPGNDISTGMIFGTLNISTGLRSGNAMITDRTTDTRYILNQGKTRWEKFTTPSLTQSELRTLRFAAQGGSIKTTAINLRLSTASVRKYRQRIFDKLGVTNINEAIIKAQWLHII